MLLAKRVKAVSRADKEGAASFYVVGQFDGW